MWGIVPGRGEGEGSYFEHRIGAFGHGGKGKDSYYVHGFRRFEAKPPWAREGKDSYYVHRIRRPGARLAARKT